MKDIMIAILGVSLMLFAAIASSDMRMEVNSNNTFCHAVKPEAFEWGIPAGDINDDNEVFLGGCRPSVDQNDDGTGDGDYIYTKQYFGDLPFTDPSGGYVQPGNGNGKAKGLQKKSRYVYTMTGAESGENCTMVDSNNTTYVTNDWNLEYVVSAYYKTITYKLACRNGAQQ